MLSRCVLTVASVMNRRAAASRLVPPEATSSRTSSSRWLSGPDPGVRTRLISRAVTAGDSTDWPWAAARTARSSSAPAGRVVGGLLGRLELGDDPGQALGQGVVDLPGHP